MRQHGKTSNLCDSPIFDLFVKLSDREANQLTFDDYLFLAGHDKCCGVRLRQYKAEELAKELSCG